MRILYCWAGSMKLLVLYLIVAGLVWEGETATKSTDQLQIGVKKRVENCEVKSKKGDRLQMHYTVSATPLSYTIQSDYNRVH